MIDAGHKEIVLTGVDISDYGKDLPAPINLTKMIKSVLMFSMIFLINISNVISANSNNISEKCEQSF